MPIYDKPTWHLMKDMVADLRLREGQVLSRSQVRSWFNTQYPKIKEGTISAHLLRMSTNAPSRVHYGVRSSGEDDLLYKLDGSHFRLYDPDTDPQPIYKKLQSEPSGEEPEDEPQQQAEFAYESDLKNFLAKNLGLLEPGLRLYEDEGITGVEFPVGRRFVDILAVDANGDYVVVELKVSRGYDRVVGQLLGYMAWIEKNQADPSQEVRGFIVARKISQDLLLAASRLTDVELFEYQLSVSLHKVAK